MGGVQNKPQPLNRWFKNYRGCDRQRPSKPRQSGNLWCVWCTLSVSLSEAANNEAWLAYESGCGPPINLGDGGGGGGMSAVTHLTLSFAYAQGTAWRSGRVACPVLSISIILMVRITPLALKYDDLNYTSWCYLTESCRYQTAFVYTYDDEV